MRQREPFAERRRERHGPFARAMLIAFGLLIAIPFGAFGGFAAWDGARGPAMNPGELVAAAIFLAVAAYGAVLCWRGLRGESRARAWTRRLAVGVLALLGVGGAASFVEMIRELFTLGPLALAHAPGHTAEAANWLFLTTALALPIQLAAHELGHLVAGWLVGCEFLSVNLGPFRFDRGSGRWRVAWEPLAVGFGGRAQMLFLHADRLAQRTALFAAGGPAGNLVLALVTGLAAMALPSPQTGAAALAMGGLKGCAVEGVLLAAFNLLPIRGTGLDGARMVEALRPKARPVVLRGR